MRSFEHGLDAETAGAGRDVGMVNCAQLFHPPGQPVEIEAAETPAVRQHAVEHRHVGVKLRIRRLQRHLANVGVGPAFSVAPLDIDGRPRRVVLEADPPELAGLDPLPASPAPASKAELCLGVGHRVGYGMPVNLEEGGAFHRSRRQSPGDRQRLVGRERHVDKPDRRAGGVDLPAVIRHIDQPSVCQPPILQLHDFVGICLAMRRHTQRRFEPLASALDGGGQQYLPGFRLRHAPVGALAGEHVADCFGRCGLFRIETEDFGDAARGTMVLAPDNCAAVQPCPI